MTEQPMPTRSARPAVQDRVIADIERRKEIGLERYNTLLKTFNGRSAARDLYEEQVDGLQYFRQLLDEWEVIQPVVEAAVRWRNGLNNVGSIRRQVALIEAVDGLIVAKEASA